MLNAITRKQTYFTLSVKSVYTKLWDFWALTKLSTFKLCWKCKKTRLVYPIDLDTIMRAVLFFLRTIQFSTMNCYFFVCIILNFCLAFINLQLDLNHYQKQAWANYCFFNKSAFFNKLVPSVKYNFTYFFIA